MKKQILLFLLLIQAVILTSCQYDKTQEFRLCFTSEKTYEGMLSLGDVSHRVILQICEDQSLSLQFTEGTLKGLTKRLSRGKETHSYQGMEFVLSAPTEFYRLYQAFSFLGTQQYSYSSPDEIQSFSFSSSDFNVTTCIHTQSNQLLEIEITEKESSLSFAVTQSG